MYVYCLLFSLALTRVWSRRLARSRRPATDALTARAPRTRAQLMIAAVQFFFFRIAPHAEVMAYELPTPAAARPPTAS
jgi:hypothetical protein